MVWTWAQYLAVFIVFAIDDFNFDVYVRNLWTIWVGESCCDVDVRDVKSVGRRNIVSSRFVLAKCVACTILICCVATSQRRVVKSIAVCEVFGNIKCRFRLERLDGFNHVFAEFFNSLSRELSSGLNRCGSNTTVIIFFNYITLACGVKCKFICEFVFSGIADAHRVGSYILGSNIADANFFFVKSYNGSRSNNEANVNYGRVVFVVVECQRNIISTHLSCIVIHHGHRYTLGALAYNNGGVVIILTPRLVACGLACNPVDFFGFIECAEYGVVLFKPIVIPRRSSVFDMCDCERSRTFVLHIEACFVVSTHCGNRTGGGGIKVTDNAFHDDWIGGEYGFCFACESQVDGYFDSFATGNIGVESDIAIVLSSQLIGVDSDVNSAAWLGSNGVFNNREELNGIVENNIAFGNAETFGAVFIRETCETKDSIDVGIFAKALILEFERTVFLHDELIANAQVHRVAIFHPRDDCLVVGEIMVGTGSFALVHSVKTPVRCNNICIYSTCGEFGGRFGPDVVVVAFGEWNETGVVDIHCVVFLTIEWEFKRKLHFGIVVIVVVSEVVLFAQTGSFNVNPFKCNAWIVNRSGIRIGNFGIVVEVAEWDVFRVGCDRVHESFVAVVCDSQRLGERSWTQKHCVNLFIAQVDRRTTDNLTSNSNLVLISLCEDADIVTNNAFGYSGHCDDNIFWCTGSQNKWERGFYFKFIGTNCCVINR